MISLIADKVLLEPTRNYEIAHVNMRVFRKQAERSRDRRRPSTMPKAHSCDVHSRFAAISTNMFSPPRLYSWSGSGPIVIRAISPDAGIDVAPVRLDLERSSDII